MWKRSSKSTRPSERTSCISLDRVVTDIGRKPEGPMDSAVVSFGAMNPRVLGPYGLVPLGVDHQRPVLDLHFERVTLQTRHVYRKAIAVLIFDDIDRRGNPLGVAREPIESANTAPNLFVSLPDGHESVCPRADERAAASRRPLPSQSAAREARSGHERRHEGSRGTPPCHWDGWPCAFLSCSMTCDRL